MILVLLLLCVCVGALLMVRYTRAPMPTLLPIHPTSHWFKGSVDEMVAALTDCTLLQLHKDRFRTSKFKPWEYLLPGLPGARTVSFAETADVRHILKSEFDSFEKGPFFRDAFEELLGTGIFAVDGDAWRTKRKISSHMFSTRTLRDRMEAVFTNHCGILTSKLQKAIDEAGQGQGQGQTVSVNLQDYFFRFTFDSICSVAFGIDVNSLHGEPKDLAFVKAYDGANRASFLRLITPPVVWKVQRWLVYKGWEVSPSEVNMMNSTKVVNAYVMAAIKTRREKMKDVNEDELKGPQDLLTLYVKYNEKKGLPAFTDEYLRDVVLNFIIAGRDTTACALTWMVYCLATHPELESELLEEMEEVGADDPSVSGLDYATAQKMSKMAAFFYETCRLYPPVPCDGKTVVAKSVTLPSGVTVKEHDQVSYVIHVQNRNPDIWPEPDKFDMNRFLDENGNFTEPDQYAYPTFNGMPRLCLGKQMARFEAAAVFSELLRQFTFRLDPEKMDMDKTPKYDTHVTLMTRDGMHVLVEKRHR